MVDGLSVANPLQPAKRMLSMRLWKRQMSVATWHWLGQRVSSTILWAKDLSITIKTSKSTSDLSNIALLWLRRTRAIASDLSKGGISSKAKDVQDQDHGDVQHEGGRRFGFPKCLLVMLRHVCSRSMSARARLSSYVLGMTIIYLMHPLMMMPIASEPPSAVSCLCAAICGTFDSRFHVNHFRLDAS
jgi:hypothetical protein